MTRTQDASLCSPRCQFLETITRGEQTRGAIQVVNKGEQLVLKVNSRQKAIGVQKTKSYVKESVMPLAQAIERLRRFARRLISGKVKNDGKDVPFEMGHKPDGTAYLCIGGEANYGDDVAARLAKMVPHTKPDLVRQFAKLDPLMPDDLDPTPLSVRGVASLHPSALHQDEYGSALLFDCYNELCNFAHLKFKIDPPPKKAEAAVVAAKEALEAAKQRVAEERAGDERRLKECTQSIAETKTKLQCADEELKQIAEKHSAAINTAWDETASAREQAAEMKAATIKGATAEQRAAWSRPCIEAAQRVAEEEMQKPKSLRLLMAESVRQKEGKAWEKKKRVIEGCRGQG